MTDQRVLINLVVTHQNFDGSGRCQVLERAYHEGCAAIREEISDSGQ